MSDQRSSGDVIDPRLDLRADCSRCEGLCCVAPAFAESADFAIDKPAGRACPNLCSDFSCGIHANLREQGFSGCTVFDCFGAGQQVVQITFAEQDWRQTPDMEASMFAVFNVMRQLKELLWYLAEALASLPPGSLREEVLRAQVQANHLVGAPAPELQKFDVAAHRTEVGPLLSKVSVELRAGIPSNGRDRINEDLVGAKLRGADLRGISLRGAYLIGADLRDANLTKTDLLGADLRSADLRGAHLMESLFLTQPQLTAAVGDSRTSIPKWLTRPAHWSSGQPVTLKARAQKSRRD